MTRPIRSLRQPAFAYYDFLSLKAHLFLDEMLQQPLDHHAATLVYYYLEICWLAAGIGLKQTPVRLERGRQWLAMHIRQIPAGTIPEASEIKQYLHDAISSADGVAKRLGTNTMQAAHLSLAHAVNYQSSQCHIHPEK
jgi:hypothetical protein